MQYTMLQMASQMSISNESNNTVNSDTRNSFPCQNCKESCEGTDCILCDYCSYWFHNSCTTLSKTRLNQLKRNVDLKYKCHLYSRM